MCPPGRICNAADPVRVPRSPQPTEHYYCTRTLTVNCHDFTYVVMKKRTRKCLAGMESRLRNLFAERPSRIRFRSHSESPRASQGAPMRSPLLARTAVLHATSATPRPPRLCQPDRLGCIWLQTRTLLSNLAAALLHTGYTLLCGQVRHVARIVDCLPRQARS
jgi:hypothetical protein